MDTDAELIKKYESYISELEAANAQQRNVIAAQQKEIDILGELLSQKDEKIALLTTDMEKTMEAAKEMAKVMDSLFQN